MNPIFPARFWRLALPLLALGAGGCAAPNPGSPSQGGMVRGVAASIVTARAFDRAQLALRRDDNAALEDAGRQMRRVARADPNGRLASAFITSIAFEAQLLANQSEIARGDEKIRLQESSNARYRAALAFAPEKSPEKSLDARNLNALGYFLADRGSSRADFERAAVFTRAAFQNWDMSGKTGDANAVGRATNAQDSYAWALFKLGKYEAARVQQEQVWETLRGMGESASSADIPFHLGEIYRALNREKAARDAYEAALPLATSKAMRVMLESRLEALDLPRV